MENLRINGMDNESNARLIEKFVCEGMKQRDRYVSMTFNPDGTVYVSIYPYGSDKDAIPVEWLAKNLEMNSSRDSEEETDIAKAITLILDLWAKKKDE